MAVSGSYLGAIGGGGEGPRLRLDWARTQIDEAGNRSLINLKLYLVWNRSELTSLTSARSGVVQGISFTHPMKFPAGGTHLLSEQNVWMAHADDGTLTTTFSASFEIKITWNSQSVQTISVSGSDAIDAIPRASDLTAFTLNDSSLARQTSRTINYTIARKSPSYTHALTVWYNNTFIMGWTTASTGALNMTLAAANVDTLLSLMPTVVSGTLELRLQTFSAGGLPIGTPVSRTVGITVNASVIPTVTAPTDAIFGTGRDKTINQYVQSISKVTASCTPTGVGGASITATSITVRRKSDGGNAQIISGASGTTAGVLTLDGVYEIIVTTTDSRGRTGTNRKEFTVQKYTKPAITTFRCNRNTATSTTVNATINATWAVIGGTLNPTDVSIIGRRNDGVTATHHTTPQNTSGALNATQNYTSQLDVNSYTYTLTITDSFGNTATAVQQVSTTFVELSIAQGKGIGVGKVHQNGALDVQGACNLTGSLNIYGNPNTLAINPGGSRSSITAIPGVALSSDMILEATNIVYLRGNAVRVTAEGETAVYRPINASAFTVNSLEKSKVDIEKISCDALSIVTNADIHQYRLKNEVENSRPITHYGLVIGEDYNTPKEVLGEYGEGVELYAMASLAWKAIQELSVKVEALEARVADLERENARLKTAADVKAEMD